MLTRSLIGEGATPVRAEPAQVWDALLDPDTLRRLIPGAERVERLTPEHYQATLAFAVGPLQSRFHVELYLSEVHRPRTLSLGGSSRGLLGGGRANATVCLEPDGAGTLIRWRYDGAVLGPVALAGRTLLEASGSHFVDRFFTALSDLLWPAFQPMP